MPLVSVELGFIFLLASLGLLVPLVLMANKARPARTFAIALIVGSNAVGCLVGVLCFWRESHAVVDLTRVVPFPFVLGIDRLSALFLLLVCAVAIPVTIFASPIFRHSLFRATPQLDVGILLPFSLVDDYCCNCVHRICISDRVGS